MAYVDPPLDMPPGVAKTFHPGKPLSFKEADPASSSDITHNWLDLFLLASRFPCLNFVVEGSIDWRIGITERMARSGDRQMRNSNWVTLSLPRGTFFLMPPGVPYQVGDFNHWDRSARQGIPVKVLCVQFHRYGMTCHVSYTQGTRNIRDSPLFVADSRTIHAAESLIEELSLHRSDSTAIVGSLLQFCLQRLERGLQNEVALQAESSSAATVFPHSNAAETVQQVCVYLETYFDRQLTLDTIANHVYISASHLTRLFRAEKGMSINEYLTKFRLEHVCTLLANTDLRINHIGKISGFTNQSYLCQVFQRHLGCSPQEYRYDSIAKNKVR